jgi:hypothetical protein
MRHIDPHTWQDEFFGAQLNITERLIWLGMIAGVADDQGRMLDNPALLRSLIFPFDDGISLETITAALEKLVNAEKIIRYQAQGKNLLQIINWWKYQSSASWMSPSKYPPPDGWQDFYRYHAAGKTLVTSPNWKNRAGGSVLPSDELPNPLPNDDVNEDEYINENDEKKDGLPATQDSTPSASTNITKTHKSRHKSASKILDSSARQELCQILQTAELPTGWDSAIEIYFGLREKRGEELISAAQVVLSHWTKTCRKKGTRKYSKFNPGWVDWLVAYLAGEKPWERAQADDEPGVDAQLAAAGFTFIKATD